MDRGGSATLRSVTVEGDGMYVRREAAYWRSSIGAERETAAVDAF